jgi:STE24 endopeptidase
MTLLVLTVFLACFTAHTLLETGLALLNLRHSAAGGKLPKVLRQRIAAAPAKRSRAYTRAKGRLEIAERLYDAALLLVVLLSGLLPGWEAWLAGRGIAGPHAFVAFLSGIFALLALAGLPFGLYRTFGLEARFGFNRATPLLWLLDRLKGLALGAALGVPLLYLAHAVFSAAGERWWLWVFALLAAVQVLLLWLYPALIAPLFNRFTALPKGELRRGLEALARRAGFRPRGIYVVDASRRSGHSNAYVAGIGRPRIVLFDTLIGRLTRDEALAVLAHEMGHYRERHIATRLALNLLSLLAGLVALSWLAAWEPAFHAFGFAAPSFQAALALALLGGGAFTFPLQPLAAWHSRRQEYQADAYSVRLLRKPAALQSALARLGEDNLSNLHPHPWYSAYHASHPVLPERLAAIDRAAKAS